MNIFKIPYLALKDLLWTAFTAAFFEENLHTNFYFEAPPKNSSYPTFAYRKIFNPLHQISFVTVTLLLVLLTLGQYIFTTLVSAIGYLFEGKEVFNWPENNGTLSKSPLKTLKAIATLSGVMLIILKLIYSSVVWLFHPINSILEWVKNLKQRPFITACFFIFGLLLATTVILATVFSGGLTLPAALLFLKPLAALFTPAIAWAASGIGLLAAKIIFGIVLFGSALNIVKILQSLFFPSFPAPGNNFASQLYFSSPENAATYEPQKFAQHTWLKKLSWGTKKSFGWNPTEEQSKNDNNDAANDDHGGENGNEDHPPQNGSNPAFLRDQAGNNSQAPGEVIYIQDPEPGNDNDAGQGSPQPSF